jgi:hypothetical protein
VTIHTKRYGFYILIEVNDPILGDGGKTVVHNVTKNLEIFMLVACQCIKMHMKGSIQQILTDATKL